MYQQSYETDEEHSNLTTEAISNWASYKRARRDQESPPVVTVTYTQASYDDIDKFDIEKPTKTQSKAAKMENEYFKGIRNHDQPEIQMAIPISPSAMMMTQQQQRRIQQQQEHSPPVKSNKTATPSS